MIVVSDTSPICYLLLIDQIEILPRLYSRVIIPSAVADELKATEAPRTVQNWINQPPSWLEVQTVSVSSVFPEVGVEKLDPGEREAILLAEQLRADLVVLDDKAARQIALGRGLRIIGLLGILKDAAKVELVDPSTAFERLREVGFWVAPSLLQRLLDLTD